MGALMVYIGLGYIYIYMSIRFEPCVLCSTITTQHDYKQFPWSIRPFLLSYVAIKLNWPIVYCIVL
jgi:hypothetical protein